MRRLLLAVAIVAISSGAFAQKQPFSGPIARSVGVAPLGSIAGPPNQTLTIDLTGLASWDSLGDTDNDVLLELLGEGAVVTGVGWDITLTTVGASWLSEVDISFSGRDAVVTTVTPGAIDGMPGTATYNSGGIVDFTDNAASNIVIGSNNMLRIELSDSFDDNADAIDATYDATSTITIAYRGPPTAVPALSPVSLVALFGALGLFAGFFLYRRRRAQ